jgi:hypothetical protein
MSFWGEGPSTREVELERENKLLKEKIVSVKGSLRLLRGGLKASEEERETILEAAWEAVEDIWED